MLLIQFGDGPGLRHVVRAMQYNNQPFDKSAGWVTYARDRVDYTGRTVYVVFLVQQTTYCVEAVTDDWKLAMRLTNADASYHYARVKVEPFRPQ